MNKYTFVVAFRGTFMQTQVEAKNTFEAYQAVLQKMKNLGDDRNEIISITISDCKLL